LGINNVAKANRLPDGAVRDLVNFDPAADGLLGLRAGYDRVMDCVDARHVFSVNNKLVVVDGTDLVSFDPLTGGRVVLGTVAAGSPVSGATLHGELFLSTHADSLRTDGVTVRAWAVPAPGFGVEEIAGQLPAGIYQVAVTALDGGAESGVDPVLIRLSGNSGIRVTSTDQRPLRVYISTVNSATLYYQGPLIAGATAFGFVRDETEYLTTAGLTHFPHCDQLVQHHAVLVGCRDRYVYFTLPHRPHLTDPVAGFFQYPAPIRVLAATDGGVYIVADQTYFLTGLETDKPQQRVVLGVDAVGGTAVNLPDGRVAWFTRYGQAIGAPDGTVQLVNRQTFAPDVAETGAAGLVGHNGNEMIVTTMRGGTNANGLATGDFADLEIG